MQGAHVVQAVGQLDQQHAHVVGDGEQELAQVFRLLGLLGDQVELFQLGQALDQPADVRAEQAVDVGTGGLGVLDRVVQQCRRDGRVVQLEVGEDRRHFQRMREIGVARGAALRAMRLHGVDIGAVQQRLVGMGVVAADPLDQLVLPHHLRRAGMARFVKGLRRNHGCGRPLRRCPGGRLLLHSRQMVGACSHVWNRYHARRP